MHHIRLIERKITNRLELVETLVYRRRRPLSIGTWRNYQQKETHTELLTAFGWGDGGGGPTREMLENGRRLANHPGAPRVRQGSACEFFQNLEAQAGGRLPVWNGELYLEYHRGTYTSQGRTKRANRQSEFLLHDAEFLAAWAALASDYEYPHAELTRAWELLCLSQFHDVLPGSSIGQVYEDSGRDYEAIRAIGEQVRETALAALARLLPEETTFVAVNFYDEKQWAVEPAYSLTIIETGPLRAGLEIRRRLLNSEIVQRVYLYRNSRRLDFDTWVDWRERHVLLKVAFPADVLSPVATYDIQWGNIQRPTHRNTSWDWARFEAVTHKWVDLSEGDYGVSLLNDCKYGHDVQGNVIRLTLLRGPTYPDPDADQGEHRFTYSLLPHAGDWRMGTVPASYALNDPLLVRRVNGGGDGDTPSQSLVTVDMPNVIIETVKQAEDGEGLIVRLYENERCRGPVALQVGFPLAAAYRCNLLEQDEASLFTTSSTSAIRLSIAAWAWH